jgi:4-diphosphocytidyl-2-C-methyl-D-erythritol kinase
MPEKVRLRAMAKLNLFLRVTGKLDDGFHQLETVFHSVGLSDLLELTSANEGAIDVEMEASRLGGQNTPVPDANLVTIAARRLVDVGRSGMGAAIKVTKNIPIGAGLAGGSADAAATLVGLNVLWGLGLSMGTIVEIAAELGSDVPYCVVGGTAFGDGRGVRLEQLPDPVPLWFVLGISDRPLMTAAVFDAWDEVGVVGRGVAADRMISALTRGDLREIAAALHNDLYLPAVHLRPDIEAGVAAMVDAGAVGATMTGSGPTVFGLATGRDQAKEIARNAARSFPRVEVVSSSPVGVEWT